MRYSCTSYWLVRELDHDYCVSQESKLAFSTLAEKVKGIVTYKDHNVHGFCLVVVISIEAETEMICERLVADAIRQTWLNPNITLKGIELIDHSQSDRAIDDLRDHPAIVALRNFIGSRQILDDIFSDPKFN